MATSGHHHKRDISEDGSPDPSDSKKRRGQSASSRGVANLTPDQLAKKRANDREAQRAIRERTKNQIETLERRIRDLTSQQPYQELQHVLRQKEAVEAENADIRKRLSSVVSMLEPVLGQPQLSAIDGTFAPPPQPFLLNRSGSSNLNMSSPGGAPSPNSVGSTWQQNPTVPMTGDGRNFPQSRAFTQQRYDLVHGLDMGPERLGLDFLLDNAQRINKIPNGMNGSQNSPNYHSPNSRHDNGGQMHQRGSSRDSNTSRMDYGSALHTGEMMAHVAPVRNCAPTCPLDNILLDFLHERQQQAADGVATPKLVGPAYPSVSSLLNPAHSVHSHPLSKVFTDILATFPDLSNLPEKVAVLYIMFLIMRWQISPTQENYERLPEWVTPRPSQLFMAHPAWVDHLPWPRMRDKVIYSPHDYVFVDFFVPFTTTLSLNWPYEETDTLLSTADSDELMINPVFERHLRMLENWSLGPSFAKSFPNLVGSFRLKQDGKS